MGAGGARWRSAAAAVPAGGRQVWAACWAWQGSAPAPWDAIVRPRAQFCRLWEQLLSQSSGRLG